MNAVYVCYGKDCRKRRKDLSELRAVLEGFDVRPVRCQDICKGPVVGVERDGDLRWFKRIRGPKALTALVRWIAAGRRKPRLWKLHVKKRRGRKR